MTRNLKRTLIFGGTMAALATPTFALFGVGDIVFDPTSYASLVQQLTTIQMQYTMLKNNIANFSLKNEWQVVKMQLENVNVANMFGETAGMSVALNTNSPTAALSAWKMGTVAVNGNASTYLATQTPGTSSMLGDLAFIETSDSVSPGCLNSVGQYRAQISQNLIPQTSLTSFQFDTTAATNSTVQQLNLLNAGNSQQMAELQAQGSMQTCQAAQLALANMRDRNAVAQNLNDAMFVQAQQAVNPTYPANESSTWSTFLP